MEDLIIVADGIIWMDRYENDTNHEVMNYQHIFENVGLYFWIKNSKSIKLVRILPVFEKLPKSHCQAVISYVCCMANLEFETNDELLDKDDPNCK